MTHFPLSWPRSPDAVHFWTRLEAAPKSVLMLDYDGTLAPFQKHPLQAYPYAGVEDRIATLSRLPRVRLVMVSGRPAREVGIFFPDRANMEIWGCHGSERLGPDGSYELLPLDDSQRDILERVRAEIDAHGFSDTLEVKPASLAVHWRRSDSSRKGEIRSLVQSLYSRYNKDYKLQLLPFDGGLELRSGGRTKGTAVQQILAGENVEAPAAYLGDDLTDEDAFAALGERGLSILVREVPRASFARFWIKPPEEMLQFLDGWIRASQAETAATRAEENPR